VKVVRNDWSDLESGYHLLTTKNASLHQKWARDIEAVRVSRHQKEHQAWSTRLAQARARSAAMRRPCVTIAGVGVVMAVAMMILASAPVFMVGLAATAGALLALYFQSAQIGELSRTEPSLDAIPRLSVDITAEWWDTIARGAREQRVHGDIGEVALLTQLSAALPDDYVCMRGVLVAPSLDADVIVVGPSGLWILDSKYWNGTITCRNGQWSRRKQYYEPGGYEAYQDDPIDHPFDRQCERERDCVRATLERRKQDDFKSITNEIYGGIVFTHPHVALDIDNSCRVMYGTTSYCVGRIINVHAGSVRAMNPTLCLAVFDALTTHGQTLGDSSARQSASALASALADAMDCKAAQFVAVRGGTLEGAGRREATLLSSLGIHPSKGILALLAFEVWLTIALFQYVREGYATQMAAVPSTDPISRVGNSIGYGLGVCLALALI